eukprot:8506031-Pyramimonas_sp.AAC.1
MNPPPVSMNPPPASMNPAECSLTRHTRTARRTSSLSPEGGLDLGAEVLGLPGPLLGGAGGLRLRGQRGLQRVPSLGALHQPAHVPLRPLCQLACSRRLLRQLALQPPHLPPHTPARPLL